MEETIRALQANEARPDARYGDCSLFPGMRLPSKVKIPEFKTYEGTTDPRHHLRHYQGKMLQYWEYEEFVIHSFQDNLSGSALDWFMSLKAEDIPTWVDLSWKFIDQYQYWVYYSHLLAHTSSFSNLIEAGKKFNLGIKLGRMEGPALKGEESAKRTSAMPTSSSGRRGKEVSVNAVNPARATSQQYSINYTPLPPVVPAYTPPAPQYRPQPQSPVVHHYASTPPQAPQYRPTSSGASQSVQQVPPPQGQPRGVVQSHTRRQYPSLPVPLSHIYQQLHASNKIGTIAPGPNFDPTIQDQSKQSPNVQTNPLPDHGPAQGPSINMIGICMVEEGESKQGDSSPFVIEYVPTEATVGFAGIGASPAPFVIDVPVREPYFNDKVPWTYEGGVGNLEQQFNVMGVTHSGRLYENPATADKGKAPAAEVEAIPRAPPAPPKKVTEEEVEANMKIIKASEYKVVEQMAKSPAHVSLLALLLSSEPHREALLRVLTAAQVPKGTPPDWMEETVSSIFSSTISFSDDELPSEGCTHSWALHIVYKCNNHTVGRVMIDNGSALNVCPVTTLKQMNMDLNRVRLSKTAVRAFDGSRREANGEIDLLIDVGPCSFSITFQVLDISNAFSLLLGRPWIHSAGATISTASLRTMGGSTGACKFPHCLTVFPDLHSSSGAPLTALPWTSMTRLTLCQPCMPSPRRFLQGFTSARRRKMRSLTIGPQSRAIRL
ncbi:hypothetical protein CRG98_030066 [Punica granatum]|uniref:Retrotransposon gag domain-containing protein n=1 Tax=Punica granatum TaxID=22663 RepID=A0A2I0IZV5_PUNGR|nr:hypothetical protein CRG98_030066 [Punica granatum]